MRSTPPALETPMGPGGPAVLAGSQGRARLQGEVHNSLVPASASTVTVSELSQRGKYLRACRFARVLTSDVPPCSAGSVVSLAAAVRARFSS